MKNPESQEREELVKKYITTQDERLKEDILIAFKSLVEFIARKLSFNIDDIPDLIQVGNIGLLKSLETFDLDRNIAFSTYASSNVIGEIRHYIRDKGRIVKLPRKLQEQYSKIRQYIKIKSQELDRFPTTSEIAADLKLSEEEVLESMEAGQSFRVISLDKPIQTNKNKSSNEKFSLIDNIGSEEKDDLVLNREMLKQALENLNEREKKLIYLRFYEGLTQKEIAERLSLSQMHVSRLLNDSLQKLRRKITIEK
ncbi:MAG: sigma-70 family RNA polymerase sigma factor [Candidatus Margulisiibacteriota bacterium]|nr:sigma-70 family RNA polymerase sigma factor [Candidatus Margulisiibacteriota bacterium]